MRSRSGCSICSTWSSCRAISPASAPAPTVGRAEAAGRHRPGLCRRSQAGHRRRAGLGARRLGPGGGGRAVDGHPARTRHDPAVHQPRPVGGALSGRPHRGHVSRPYHGEGHHRPSLRAALPSLYRGPAVGRAHRRSHGDQARDRARRHPAQPAGPAGRLPLRDPAARTSWVGSARPKGRRSNTPRTATPSPATSPSRSCRKPSRSSRSAANPTAAGSSRNRWRSPSIRSRPLSRRRAAGSGMLSAEQKTSRAASCGMPAPWARPSRSAATLLCGGHSGNRAVVQRAGREADGVVGHAEGPAPSTMALELMGADHHVRPVKMIGQRAVLVDGGFDPVFGPAPCSK